MTLRRRGRFADPVPRAVIGSNSSAFVRAASIIAALAFSISACTAPTSDRRQAEPPPASSDTTKASGQAAKQGPDPEVLRLSRMQWQAMKRSGMVRPECPIQRRSDLRLVRINFVDFEGGTQRGALTVNADVAPSIVRIFSRLYESGFPIRRMRPVEAYRGNSNASLRADNTSAYNCRRADQINAPFRESPHANGRAIDVNPRENPWMDLRCNCWYPTDKTKERTAGPGVIVKGGLVWRSFTSEGWVWQNIDVPDYMHFDTGYPSRPFSTRDVKSR